VAKELGIPLLNHHRAVDDAEATALIFNKFLQMLTEKGAKTLRLGSKSYFDTISSLFISSFNSSSHKFIIRLKLSACGNGISGSF
ncbi:hypothetical protein ACTPEM_24390, partial [Clostridioides difficile]